MRKTMVDREHPRISVRRQCELLGVNRNRLDPRPAPVIRPAVEALALEIDRLHLDYPELGARRISHWLGREGWDTSRWKVARLMKRMGIEAVYRRPNTSKPAPGHKIYPYLLRNLEVSSPDEVWCADITYIPLARGFGYLVAIMDWKSRAVLSWKVSNTLDVKFCVEAYHEAVAKAGRAPAIFNTDQGSQFTSREWIDALEGDGVRVSMDGKGRWMDNVFIERLWRAVKHEGVYLWAHNDLVEMEQHLERWFEGYNLWKPHRSLDMLTPWQVYRPEHPQPWRLAA